MRKRILSIMALIILLFVIILLMFYPNLQKPKEFDLASAKDEVLNEIKTNKEYQQKVSKWNTTEEDSGYLNLPEKNVSNKDPKLDVLKYFLTGIQTNDVDIFLSSFYPQSISEDLFKVKTDSIDKTEVVKEIMKRISKDGKLVNVKYIDEKGALGSSTNKITLILQYKDKTEVKVKISAILLGDKHHKENKVYVINTSAWDIIKQIEREP